MPQHAERHEQESRIRPAIRFVFRTGWRVARGRFLADLVLEPLGFVTTIILGLWLKLITDEVLSSDVSGATLYAMAFAGTIALMFLLQGAGAKLRAGLDERVRFWLDLDLARAVGARRDLAFHEDPAQADVLSRLRGQTELIGRGPGLIVVTLGHLVRLLLLAALLASVDPLLLLLPAFGLAPLGAAALGERWIRQSTVASEEGQRIAQHVLDTQASVAAATESRIYGLQELLKQRYLLAWNAAGRVLDAGRAKATLVSIGAWIVLAAGFAGALVLVAMRTRQGQASSGELLMVLYLSAMVSGQVQAVSWSFSQCANLLRATGEYIGLRLRAEEESASGDTTPPARLAEGIRLTDVGFRYRSGNEALSSANLIIPPGTVVALVGENGAGKSTLAKLLLDLYRPTSGKIEVEGTDLRQIDASLWWRKCSAAFQDPARLELLALEAVGAGDVDRISSESAVRSALERAGVENLLEALPDGLGTQLGPSWGGTDLSQGQWQKLAVARAMMRPDPLLRVLDEPTSSLDADAESELFRRYQALARDRTCSGGITLLISHRLSSVRMADLIVVMEAGRILEQGTHDELMRLPNGRYAELNRMQARAYFGARREASLTVAQA